MRATDTVAGFNVRWVFPEHRTRESVELRKTLMTEMGLPHDTPDHKLLGVFHGGHDFGTWCDRVLEVKFGVNGLGELLLNAAVPGMFGKDKTLVEAWEEALKFFRTHRDTVKDITPELWASVITRHSESGFEVAGIYRPRGAEPFLNYALVEHFLTKQGSKPGQTELESALDDYLAYLRSGEKLSGNGISERERAVFEKAVEMFCGKGVWDEINELTKGVDR